MNCPPNATLELWIVPRRVTAQASVAGPDGPIRLPAVVVPYEDAADVWTAVDMATSSALRLAGVR